MSGEPVWLEQLGIGRAEGTYQGITREWLYWYDENQVHYLTPEERANRAESDLQQLRDRLQQLNINPDSLL